MIHFVDISEVLLEVGLSSSVTEEERAIVTSSINDAESAVRRFLKYDPAYQEHTEYYPNMDFTRTGRIAVWEVSNTTAYQRQLAEMSTTELQIRHLPLRAVTTLQIDYDGRAGSKPGAFGSGTNRIEGTDFWPNYDRIDSQGNQVCSDGILRSEGYWPAISGCVKIVYFAGYTAAELRGQDAEIDASPIWEVVKYEAMRRIFRKFNLRKSGRLGWAGPLTSERLGDYSYQRDAKLYEGLISSADLSPGSVEKLSQFENYGWALCS